MTLKIPYGLSNFHDVATQGYTYVDKTDYIAKLEDGNSSLPTGSRANDVRHCLNVPGGR